MIVGLNFIRYRPTHFIGRWWQAWGFSVAEAENPRTRRLVITEDEAMEWYAKSKPAFDLPLSAAAVESHPCYEQRSEWGL